MDRRWNGVSRVRGVRGLGSREHSEELITKVTITLAVGNAAVLLFLFLLLLRLCHVRLRSCRGDDIHRVRVAIGGETWLGLAAATGGFAGLPSV